MGGRAFSAQSNQYKGKPIDCLRVPDHIYCSILSRFLDILSSLFQHVASPPPAPGKGSHGDIDVLAFSPLDPLYRSDHAAFASYLADKLNATSYVLAKPTICYAILVPEVDGHVQVDVHICPTKTAFDVELFQHSYADAWSILNTSARYCNLSLNGNGLRLIVYHNHVEGKEKSYLVLTADPEAILSFFGLDDGQWQEGFGNRKELFDYLAGNRFLKPSSFEREVLIGNDRHRMDSRAMFNEWVDEYLPTRRDLKEREAQRAKDRTALTKEVVREEALDAFGKRQDYDALLRRVQAEEGEKKTWHDVGVKLAELCGDKETDDKVQPWLLVRRLRRRFNAERGDMLQQLNEHEATRDLASLLSSRRVKVMAFVTGNWEKERDALSEMSAGSR